MPTGQTRSHVSVDRERCAGHGVCMIYAPGAFDLDDDGVAVVIDQGADAESLRRAKDNCPEHAITVEENS